MRKSQSETELIAAAIAGDSDAFGQLLFVHSPALERHIRPRIPADLQRHLGVDDVLQDVFAHAFRDVGTFDPKAGGSFLAWLKVIADHRLTDALKHLRRKKRGGDRRQVTAEDPAATSSVGPLIDVVCRDDLTASRVFSRNEAARALQIAVAMLPENQRRAIRARYFSGQSVENIASQAGCTDGAIRGHIHRGQKKLAELMGSSSHWLSK